MAARIKVDVTLSKNEYDWGSPSATEVTICWSASKIHESKNMLNKSDPEISKYNVKSITVSVSNDKGQTKSHSFVKSSSGYVNTFILQGENYYRIGEGNSNVPVTAVTGTTETLDWTQRGSDSQISVTQFAANWVHVKAQGSNWGNNNSCNHRRAGGSQTLKSDVNTIYECAESGVQAFDYNNREKTCLLFKDSNFNPAITSASGRNNPGTQCYMLKTEYEKVKGVAALAENKNKDCTCIHCGSNNVGHWTTGNCAPASNTCNATTIPPGGGGCYTACATGCDCASKKCFPATPPATPTATQPATPLATSPSSGTYGSKPVCMQGCVQNLLVKMLPRHQAERRCEACCYHSNCAGVI